MGPGWAQCHIAHDTRSLQISINQQCDALGDLIRTANRLRNATEPITFSWKIRSGEYRWSFKPVGAETQVLIERLRSWDEGDAVFEARVPTTELIRAVAMAGQLVLTDVGAERYRERWSNHPFPTAELARIAFR